MHSQQGSMAEWLGTGLQNRLLQFESGWDLKRMLRHPFLIPHRNHPPCQVYIAFFYNKKGGENSNLFLFCMARFLSFTMIVIGDEKSGRRATAFWGY